jgi:hypothetical protein
MSGYGMNVAAVLNQQCLQAVGLAQQAVMAEQSGWMPAALANWEQACAALSGVVIQSRQAMLPLSDQVHFGLAVAEYHTARLKFVMGRGMESPSHLGIGLQAIQAAIMQNPMCPPYHTFAGGLLLCVGNLPGAAQELMTALSMNPADQAAQTMLAAIQAHMTMMPPISPPMGTGGFGMPPAAPWPGGMAMGGGAKGFDLKSGLELAKVALDVMQGLKGLFG